MLPEGREPWVVGRKGADGAVELEDLEAEALGLAHDGSDVVVGVDRRARHDEGVPREGLRHPAVQSGRHAAAVGVGEAPASRDARPDERLAARARARTGTAAAARPAHEEAAGSSRPAARAGDGRGNRRSSAASPGQSSLRTSSMTLPSLGRAPGATSSTSPRSLQTSRIDSATAAASASPAGARLAAQRHDVRVVALGDDQARAVDLRMPADDLGDQARVDEHPADLRALVGAAEPPADPGVRPAAGALARQNRGQVAGRRTG